MSHTAASTQRALDLIVYEILGRNSGHVRPQIEKGWVATINHH